MGYAAVVLAILGFGVGAAFRLKVLLLILAVLLVFSAVFEIAQGFDFVHIVVTIIETQTSAQVGYFLGVVARSIFHSRRRMQPDNLMSNPRSCSARAKNYYFSQSE